MKHLSSITVRNNTDNMTPIDCVIIGWGDLIRKEGEIVWTDKTSGMCMYRNRPRTLEFYHPIPDTDTFIKITLSADSIQTLAKELDELSKIEFEDCID